MKTKIASTLEIVIVTMAVTLLFVCCICTLGFMLKGNNEPKTDFQYDYAECYLNGSKRKYNISSWRYYENDLIEITTTDANTYMLSMSYCKLVNKYE